MRLKLIATVFSAAGLLASATPGFAADIPVKGGRIAAAPVVAAFSWSGFYLGANVGYGTGHVGTDATITGGGLAGTADLGTNVKGFVGGGQLGYNWQMGQFVFGIEADMNFSGQKGSADVACVAVVGCLLSVDSKIKSFETVRGRFGYTVFDRSMLYFTAGWARLSTSSTATVSAPGVSAVLFDSSNSSNGWALGFGYEQMIWDHWSWKLEYLYMKASNSIASVAIPAAVGGGTIAVDGKVTDNLFRVGMNYHF
jgi:outer membrane immunogenic protein